MNEAIRSLLERRSIRAYQDKPIPADLLEELIRVGLTAPSAVNRQPWHISVVRTKENIAAMEDAIRAYFRASGDVERADDPNFHTFYQAPVVLYVSAQDGSKYGVSDSANLVTYLALAAHALGLGSCYIASSQVMFAGESAQAMRELLQIPEGFSPAFSLAVGYAAESPAPRERRDNTVTYVD